MSYSKDPAKRKKIEMAKALDADPSGDPTPSQEDISVTEQLVEAARVLDIELVDHLVIGNHRFVSLKERLRW